MASPFSGKAGRLAGMWAAGQAQQGLNQITDTLTDAEQRASGYLTQGYGTSRDVLGSGYLDALENLRAAYGEAPGQLTSGKTAAAANLTGGRDAAIASLRGATGDINKYYDQATNALQGSAALYDPLMQRGMAGYDMYNNALGLGGAAGTAAAQGAFKTGPGYQWNVDQATDAAQRAANRTGGSLGGNALNAVTRLGSNLANQEYNNWVKNLSGYQGAALQATTGKAAQLDELAKAYGQQGTSLAGINKDIAGVQRGTSQELAGLDMKTAAALAGMTVDEGQQYAKLGTDYSSNLGQLASGYGAGMAGLITGTAGNIASAQQTANNTITQAGTQGMLAGQQASQNTWGAIMGGLGLGANLLGGGAGGGAGGLLTSLFK